MSTRACQRVHVFYCVLAACSFITWWQPVLLNMNHRLKPLYTVLQEETRKIDQIIQRQQCDSDKQSQYKQSNIMIIFSSSNCTRLCVHVTMQHVTFLFLSWRFYWFKLNAVCGVIASCACKCKSQRRMFFSCLSHSLPTLLVCFHIYLLALLLLGWYLKLRLDTLKVHKLNYNSLFHKSN